MTTGDPAPEAPGRLWPSDDALGGPQPDGASPTWASPEDEEAMRLVTARLRSAHPGADPATVDALVAGAYDELRDAKVRTFIPILTERRARALLAMPPPGTRPAPES
ncbi:three-helix bundle dimerization domain-containing protein [Kitasatospora sp. NPDC050543]|uniref:three-helix bundle dimerization domain-containing protein n=1 Tax=Kitasatospora sp. NPDC050543 TaxID=3364054 RepID=UPI00378CE4E6